MIPFDPQLEIVVTCDSSNYGISSVMAHSLPDGTERPIPFKAEHCQNARWKKQC